MLSRESICVDVNLKDTPQIPVVFASTGFGVVSTSFSQWKQGTGNKGLESTHNHNVWLGLP